jgi:hypothetical protein
MARRADFSIGFETTLPESPGNTFAGAAYSEALYGQTEAACHRVMNHTFDRWG